MAVASMRPSCGGGTKSTTRPCAFLNESVSHCVHILTYNFLYGSMSARYTYTLIYIYIYIYIIFSYPFTGNFFADGSMSAVRRLTLAVSPPTMRAVETFLTKARTDRRGERGDEEKGKERQREDEGDIERLMVSKCGSVRARQSDTAAIEQGSESEWVSAWVCTCVRA